MHATRRLPGVQRRTNPALAKALLLLNHHRRHHARDRRCRLDIFHACERAIEEMQLFAAVVAGVVAPLFVPGVLLAVAGDALWLAPATVVEDLQIGHADR